MSSSGNHVITADEIWSKGVNPLFKGMCKGILKNNDECGKFARIDAFVEDQFYEKTGFMKKAQCIPGVSPDQKSPE